MSSKHSYIDRDPLLSFALLHATIIATGLATAIDKDRIMVKSSNQHAIIHEMASQRVASVATDYVRPNREHEQDDNIRVEVGVHGPQGRDRQLQLVSIENLTIERTWDEQVLAI